jgi:acyl carrier protein
MSTVTAAATIVTGIIEEFFRCDESATTELSMETSILDAGLDSIAMMNLVATVQTAFQCELNIEITDLFLVGSFPT